MTPEKKAKSIEPFMHELSELMVRHDVGGFAFTAAKRFDDGDWLFRSEVRFTPKAIAAGINPQAIVTLMQEDLQTVTAKALAGDSSDDFQIPGDA